MESGLYTVLLVFDPNDQLKKQNIISRLAKIDPKVSEKISQIDHHRIVIKKNATLNNARKLASLLQQTGATCKIRKQPDDQKTTPPRKTASPASQNQTPALIKCPKCRSEQPPAIECRACGVIIKKARPFVEQTIPHEPAEPPKAESASQQGSTMDLVKERFATAFSALIRMRPINTERIQKWGQRLLDRAFTCVVVAVIAMALEIFLIYLFNMMWYLYTSTVVGQFYINKFPDEAGAIQQLVSTNLLLLCWDSTLVVLCTSLALAVIAQFLHLIRYLFDAMGIVLRLVFWFAPAAALAAWGIQWLYQFAYFTVAVSLAVVPTLCILTAAMQLARDTVPDIGILWKTVTQTVWKDRTPLWTKIKQVLRTWIESVQ